MEHFMNSQHSRRGLTRWAFCLALLMSEQVYAAVNLPDFTPLVEENSAAVVNISTTLKKTPGQGHPPIYNMPDIPEDSPLYDFFKKFFGEIPDGGPDPFEQRAPLGSGFPLSRDAYVITNNHVVKDADEIVVSLQDRREFVAEVVGTDERSDIAV